MQCLWGCKHHWVTPPVGQRMSTCSMPTLGEVVRELLTTERCQELDSKGYLVLRHPSLPLAMARQFLSEIKECFNEIPGGRTPNAVEFITPRGPVKLIKPSIFECDLHQKSIREQLPLFADVFAHQLAEVAAVLRERIEWCSDLCLFDDVDTTAQSITVKLQMNEHGSFPWHYDNPGRPNKRRLTMAVYLSEDWDEEKNGGELQLLPFLDTCVSVPPQFCTLVFFRSDLILHRVLPVKGERTRYCFTVWFDGFATNTDADQFLRANQLNEQAIPFLTKSPVQRVLSRAIYDEEFAAALEDCFGKESKEYQVSLYEHQARLQKLLETDGIKRFVNVLKTYRGDLQAPSSMAH